MRTVSPTFSNMMDSQMCDCMCVFPQPYRDMAMKADDKEHRVSSARVFYVRTS